MNVRNMNLELTTACPFKCSQCYCSLDNPRHMDISIAKKWVDQAAKCGVKEIALSGGETICYPHLYEIIRYAKDRNLVTHAAFSGWHFTQQVFDSLQDAGIDNICISLNGSTEEINRITRQGYYDAIGALELLHANGYKHTTINWVMHSNNADDFPQMLKLCETFEVYGVDVISFKPDSNNQMESVPSREQLLTTAEYIQNYKGPIKIFVETCFSPLRALLGETKLLGNLNVGIFKGCSAGRTAFSVSVDGLVSPCRHLNIFEKYDTLEEYWDQSSVLVALRNAENDVREPCNNCKYQPYCRHCMAINYQINNDIYIGNKMCSLQMKK